MVERVEDMQLPNAVVQRIIKEALPDGINVGKDARTEISKAASIFVLYLTSTARHQLQMRKQKTLNPTDVIQALEVMEMENFVEPLKKAMEQYKRQQKNKKDKKQPSSTTTVDTAAEETEQLADTELIPTETEEEMILDTEEPIEEDEAADEEVDDDEETQMPE